MNEKFSNDISNYVIDNHEPLDSGNYNELDALVFSSLSYIRFEDKNWGKGEVSLKAFAKEALNNPQISTSLARDDKDLLRAVALSNRYENCTIPTDRMIASDKETQWAAMTVKINDGSDSSVISMRGTDGTLTGWREDLHLADDFDGTNAQKLSAQYIKDSEGQVFLTGHSKGGNDVVSGYLMNDQGVRSRIQRIDDFDGPGVSSYFLMANPKYMRAYKELNDKLVSYYPKDAIIGLALKDVPGRKFFIDYDMTGHTEDKGVFGAHDLYSWKIRNGEFAYTEQSEASKHFNSILDRALTGLLPHEREHLVYLINYYVLPFFFENGDEKDERSDKQSFYEKLLHMSFYSLSELVALYRFLALLIISGYIELKLWELQKIFEVLKEKWSKGKKDTGRMRSKNAYEGGGSYTAVIEPPALRKALSQIRDVESNMENNIKRIENVRNNLHIDELVDEKLKKGIVGIEKKLKTAVAGIKKLDNAGDKCVNLYQNTDQKIGAM